MALIRPLICIASCLSMFAASLAAQQAPTADEMAFIYELNRARQNPPRYAAENALGTLLDLVTPRPPLALNENLVQSARFHTDEMSSIPYYFGHQSQVTGDWPNKMARDAGYPLNSTLPNNTNNIESLAAGLSTPAATLRLLIEDLNQTPPGHRYHLLATGPNASFYAQFREVGVGHSFNASAPYQHYYAIHTGYRNTDPVRMFGVVYDDANSNGRYDSGEGLSGVTVDATGPSTLQTTTNAQGAYVFDVTAGSWAVTCSGGAFSGTSNASVTVGTDNVEVDFASGRTAGERDFEFQSVGGGPVLTVTGSLTVFSSPSAGTPTAEQSYSISGVRLTGNVTITAPAEFEFSTTSGSGYVSTLQLTPSNGTLAATPIYVRFAPPGSSTGASGNMTHESGGALDALIYVAGTVSTNPAVFASPGTLNLVANRIGVTSPEQMYTVSGYNLSGNLVVGSSGDFEVSLSSGSGFGTGFSIAPSSGTVSPTTVYVRYNASSLGSSGSVTNVSGAQSSSVTVNGSVANAPQIVATPGSLTLVAPSIGNPSAEQSFTVSGQYLAGDLVVSAPSGFDLTTTSGSGYVPSVNLTPTAGVVSSTTIYVRYLGGTSSANGNVNCTSTLAGTQQVALSGSIAPPPNITLSTAGLTLNSTAIGTPSPESTYTVSGANLVGNVTLTTGAGFQISTTAGSGFTTSLQLTPTTGTLAATTIYVRYTPSATGQVVGSIAHASPAATTKYITLWGDVVTGGGNSGSGSNPGGGSCTAGDSQPPWLLLLLLLATAVAVPRFRRSE